MAGRTVDMGYLFYIELFKQGCYEEATAMSGKDLIKALSAIPLLHRKKWAPWFGTDFMIIAAGALNVHRDEERTLLDEIAAEKPNYIKLACDSNRNPKQMTSYFTAKYWLYNVTGNGQRFYCGIDEQSIEGQLALIGDFPLRGLTQLSSIQDDYDCFDYVKTWLDENWRTSEQLSQRSLKEMREEWFANLR